MSIAEPKSSDDCDKAVEDCESFVIKPMSEIECLEQKDLVKYVNKLHKVLQVKEKILTKYGEKVKKLIQELEEFKAANKTKKIDSQTTPESNETKSAKCSNSTAVSISLVDEIRQAAEQAQNLSGFVYEPTSGLYYDQKTGYYYNAEFGLYYDGNTGCYYNYNQDKNAFEFHSQVEVQPNQAATVAAAAVAKNTKRNGNGNDDDDDDDDDNENAYVDEVQFDEHGGVITDQERLLVLRKQKRKIQKELAKFKKRKKKSKGSKVKKDSKSHKRQRKSSLHVSGGGSADEAKSDKEEKLTKKFDIEDGELSRSSTNSSSSSNSSSNGKESSDNKNQCNEENGVPIFKAAGRFQGLLSTKDAFEAKKAKAG